MRARINWKYALGLEPTDPGFDLSVLSEFRARLLQGGAEELLLGDDAGEARGKRLGEDARCPEDGLDPRVIRCARVEQERVRVGETMRVALIPAGCAVLVFRHSEPLS